MEIEKLEPDSNGHYSVCMPIAWCPSFNKMELMTIFNQAGLVQRANITHKWVFIRYASKDDIARALTLFGKDYNLRLASCSKIELEKIGKLKDTPVKTNELNTNQKSATDMLDEPEDSLKKYEAKPHKNDKKKEKLNSSGRGRKFINSKVCVINCNDLPSSVVKDVNQGLQNNNHGRFGGRTQLFDKTKDELHLNKFDSQEKDSDQAISKLSIFVSNFESKEDFDELIKSYGPKSVVIKGNKPKLFAFVEMTDEVTARRAIEDLNGKKLKSNLLKAEFQKMNHKYMKKEEVSTSQGDPGNKTHKSRSSPEMPPLEPETNYSEMPDLVPESSVKDLEKHRLNCSIFVANFPVCSLESTLRKTFEKFHVLDICIINNQPGSCTKAFLYLATIYDVMAAVKEMNSSCILGLPLKVAVPFKNDVVRFVMNEIAK